MKISEKCSKAEHQDCYEVGKCSCKCHFPVEDAFDLKKSKVTYSN